jgi:glycosyltransferase involved in cell wall biosynthesis
VLPVSVVIPAHDEAAVIQRCLDTLLADARPGEVDVVVVCNGCTDDTAERARAACPDATVIELPIASKAAALNAGDRGTDLFPRIYLDADVELSTDALRATARALTEPGTLCAAPVPQFELRGRPGVVRRYYEVWEQLPYVTDDMVGTGVYGLSAAGRARFGEFPAITADDQFVLQQFERGERRAIADARFTVHTPSTIRGLLAIRRRAYRGVAELDRAGLVRQPAAGGARRRLTTLARDPRNAASVACYVLVSVYAKAAARLARGTEWERDSSSRESGVAATP